MKIIGIIVGIGILFIGGTLFFTGGELPTQDQNDDQSLTFSSTMEWGGEYLVHLEREYYFPGLEGWEERVMLSGFPSNDSEETRAELDLLLQYQEERTQAQINQTISEIDANNFIFGGRTIGSYGQENFPKTTELITEGLFDLARPIIASKVQFDRVRPHFLDDRLNPAIDVPEHAAYPSGHSTQAHFIAGILSLVNPELEVQYFEEAAQIARNREIVGVHYASDSEIGKDLALQIIAILLEDEKFQKLILEARREW